MTEPTVDPAENRQGGTMAWTVEQAMTDREKAPDAVFDRGAVGKEAMCRLFACSPTVLREQLLALDNKH